MFDLSSPIESLYLVGPARAKLLTHLGIRTLNDLLLYFPRAHQDLSQFTPIADLRPGTFGNIKARVLEVKNFRTKVRRLNLTHVLVEDDSGQIQCVWFNQPFLPKVFKVGQTFIFSGRVMFSKNRPQLQNPIYEQERPEQIHTSRLVPIYSLTAHLTQKQLRTIIKTYLDKVILPEYLPLNILRQEKLLAEDKAVKTFHFPPTMAALKAAQKRLAFDEIFQTQIRVMRYKQQRLANHALAVASTDGLADKITALPFTLTRSQQQALNDIVADLQKPFPANRLLEGDVGSGKTIVAALSMWLMAKNGLQSAFLAPTEVLAQQHYLSLLKVFLNDGFDVALLTSTASRINGNPVSKATLLAHLSSGKIKIVIGTHALLEPTVKFQRLALAVIDEQHRFGVRQRSKLKELNNTHLVTMSATPIPRTLALTLYGDLDISVLNELPHGRIPIVTELVAPDKRSGVYQFIREQIQAGRQAFVICPLIEESDKLGVKSAQTEYKKLKHEIFPELNIGLLHGKLKPADKEQVMKQFQDNQIQILVATSVVEVGVDVPNATVMIIEGAERFGLAQLHQFRGRVGRSHHQSYCFLFSDDSNAPFNLRLQAIVASTNGFELAQKDLQIRGGGDLYGTEQSGYGFKIATLGNLELVERSKGYAEQILAEDPELATHPLLREKIAELPALHME